MKIGLSGLIVVLILTIGAFRLNAQDGDETAMTLNVTFNQVYLMRAGTTQPLPVRAGAQMPFGGGDTLITDGYGRAMLSGASGRYLILPDTTFTLINADDDVFNALLTVGRVVAEINRAPAEYQVLLADRATISEPGTGFAAQLSDASAAVISAGGGAIVEAFAQEISLEAGYGVRIRDQIDPVTFMGEEASFARLDGVLDGCPGVIDTGSIALNVRNGPSLEYDVLGNMPDRLPVFLMATNPNNSRYRIQFLNNFGWVLATGVEHNCTNLPVLPYSAVESLIRVLRPGAAELSLLVPYFGLPEDDLIFYLLPDAVPADD